MPDSARPPSPRIAVIGGGLAGLAAAHRLHELATGQSTPWHVTLFEAGPRLGGIVGTERIGDYLVDIGADSFLTTKPGAVGLCRRLGIEDRLVSTDPRYRGALVLFDGRPVPIPEGFQLLSPTAMWPIMTSPLFTVWGKLRLMMEFFVPPRSTLVRTESSHNPASITAVGHSALVDDESLADFVRRRFGREALDRLIQPLVGGIYTSDPEQLSLAATMPRFLEMERDHGSLIRASLFQKVQRKNRAEEQSATVNAAALDRSSGARYGQFAGLKGGMSDLTVALSRSVEAHCHVRLQTSVTAIEQVSSESSDASRATPQQYFVTTANGTQELFDAIILATSAPRTATLLQHYDPQLSSLLQRIEFASSALVVSGHRLSDIRHPLNSFGLVIPHVERRSILAVSFSSRKFPDRAPAGHVLLRTFIGGALQPEMYSRNDDELRRIVREELSDIFGAQGEPDFMRIYRYPQAMPQYHVGHLNLIDRIEAQTSQHPGLALAGNAYRGVGVPDTITSGESAAESIASHMNSKS